MSAQSANPFEIPIVKSSVPACACGNEKPCLCNKYAHRVEQWLNRAQAAHFAALRRLVLAQQAIEELPLSSRQQIALVAVRAALEGL